ncbi:GyrI-like domain-containing protein [Bacillus sp. ISL-35]|uniref:GyrI-like domain-containing protein n=1 Tax=Bacillus sp. ISL-35 TaxID=2819122 RepID=UPI001BED07CD|nr:GyrI-like domain-containing protein [Bacillus sp. ISL-35]MBT2680111.1 GyrI-like domain-containing protein [Bacillus sp. ISL-35]MBT2704385.1 GyrI-like domain-containing protein [Chryseobacterium sp. ISL-80]
MEPKVVNKETFKAVGVKWIGTYEQAARGEIKVFHHEFLKRRNEIKHAVEPDNIFGLSYHNTKDGFTYYLALEVEDAQSIPEDMELITVPAYTFASLDYKGSAVHEAYTRLYTWVKQNEYTLKQSDLEHLEEYPGSFDPLTGVPELKIHIPIMM